MGKWLHTHYMDISSSLFYQLDNFIDSKTIKRMIRELSPDLIGSFNDQDQVSANLPSPNSLKAPRNPQEAMRYLELGVEMMKYVLDYNGAFTQEEKNAHESNLAMITYITGSGIQKGNDWITD